MLLLLSYEIKTTIHSTLPCCDSGRRNCISVWIQIQLEFLCLVHTFSFFVRHLAETFCFMPLINVHWRFLWIWSRCGGKIAYECVMTSVSTLRKIAIGTSLSHSRPDDPFVSSIIAEDTALLSWEQKKNNLKQERNKRKRIACSNDRQHHDEGNRISNHPKRTEWDSFIFFFFVATISLPSCLFRRIRCRKHSLGASHTINQQAVAQSNDKKTGIEEV